MRPSTVFAWALALSSSLTAQVVTAIDDANPTTGTSNAFPFGSSSASSGQTSLHVYSAQALRSRGICAGAILMDLQVAPSSGTAGTYLTNQAKLEIGHLAVSPPIPGNWAGHLLNPVVVHDLTSGPFTFPWTLNTWTSLPGVSTSFFIWDGVSDVGVQYTSAGSATGSFSARRTSTQLRHYVATFNATNQPPTSNGNFAMKVQMTWLLSAPCASRQSYGTGCGGLTLTASADPIPTTAVDLVTASITPTALFGAVCYGFTAFNPGLPLDSLGMTGCFQHNELLASSLFVPSGAPSVSTPFLVPNFPGVSFEAQSILYDPQAALTPLGATSSGGVTLTIGF